MDQLVSLITKHNISDAQTADVARTVGRLLGVPTESVSTVNDLLQFVTDVSKRGSGCVISDAPAEPAGLKNPDAVPLVVEPVMIAPKRALETKPLSPKRVTEPEPEIAPGVLKQHTGDDVMKVSRSFQFFDFFSHEDLYADAGFKAGLENLTPKFQAALLESTGLGMLDNKFTEALSNSKSAQPGDPTWVAKMLEIVELRPVFAYYFSRIPNLEARDLHRLARHLALTARVQYPDSGNKDDFLLSISESIKTVVTKRKHRCPEAIRILTAAISL